MYICIYVYIKTNKFMSIYVYICTSTSARQPRSCRARPPLPPSPRSTSRPSNPHLTQGVIRFQYFPATEITMQREVSSYSKASNA